MVLNPLALPHILTLVGGTTHQQSSFGRDPDRGGTWFGLRPAPARRKRILLKPGETHTMAALSGPGMITRLWMTTLLPLNSAAMRNVVLRFYWDGESEPSVESPFGDFFGAPFGRMVLYSSALMSLTNGAGNCLFPMPYADGARLEVTNEGSTVIDPLFYQITYYELDMALESNLRFHAQWRRENPTQPGVPYTILSAEGEGHYVGVHLFMQNRQWWLQPPISQMIFPNGFGMGMLEGWESIYVDGETAPSVRGTGTEDYFGGAWYNYLNGSFSAPYHGCTVRDYIRGQVAAYRFDLLAPLPFRRSLEVKIDHGFENQLVCDYASVAYWYQREPHRPFPALPDTRTRQPNSTILNVVQAGMVLGIPVIGGLSLLWTVCKRFARWPK